MELTFSPAAVELIGLQVHRQMLIDQLDAEIDALNEYLEGQE